MNRTVALAASALLTVSILVFALSMAFGAVPVSYASSLVISFGYVGLACALADEASDERRVAAAIGVAFAAMYSSLVTVVYFVQLSTVAQGSAGPQVLDALTYSELGSLMFNLDLLGYGLMAISTFFVGLSIRPRGSRDTVLRWLLILHGAFAPMCVVMPILGIFNTMPRGSGGAIGSIMLIVWCVYFTPIGVLSLLHFATSGKRPALVPQN